MVVPKATPQNTGFSLKRETMDTDILDSTTLLLVLNTILHTDSYHHTKLNKHGLPVHQDGHSHQCTECTRKLAKKQSKSHAALDAKIEKAMDNVKRELMNSVRHEVNCLQKQVSCLRTHNATLEQENKILRKSANPETLAQLDQLHPNVH